MIHKTKPDRVMIIQDPDGLWGHVELQTLPKLKHLQKPVPIIYVKACIESTDLEFAFARKEEVDRFVEGIQALIDEIEKRKEFLISREDPSEGKKDE